MVREFTMALPTVLAQAAGTTTLISLAVAVPLLAGIGAWFGAPKVPEKGPNAEGMEEGEEGEEGEPGEGQVTKTQLEGIFKQHMGEARHLLQQGQIKEAEERAQVCAQIGYHYLGPEKLAEAMTMLGSCAEMDGQKQKARDLFLGYVRS